MNLIARDLETENAELREELRRAHMELRRLDDMKRNFIALTAHELRNPLAILFGYAKLLADCGNDEIREYAGIIVKRTWQLKSAVDLIITLQQIDAGELALRLEALPLAEIIHAVIDGHQADLNEKTLTILTNVEPQLRVRADRKRIELAISEVVSNAIKYSSTGGTITLEGHAQASSVVLAVRDNGIGIAPEELSLVFQRFYQTGNPLTRQYNGFGLGLAVAKALVELHGGRIWLESASQRGSTIYLSLPHEISSDASAPDAAVAQRVRLPV